MCLPGDQSQVRSPHSSGLLLLRLLHQPDCHDVADHCRHRRPQLPRRRTQPGAGGHAAGHRHWRIHTYRRARGHLLRLLLQHCSHLYPHPSSGRRGTSTELSVKTSLCRELLSAASAESVARSSTTLTTTPRIPSATPPPSTISYPAGRRLRET